MLFYLSIDRGLFTVDIFVVQIQVHHMDTDIFIPTNCVMGKYWESNRITSVSHTVAAARLHMVRELARVGAGKIWPIG